LSNVSAQNLLLPLDGHPAEPVYYLCHETDSCQQLQIDLHLN